jgi:hypothetical protein
MLERCQGLRLVSVRFELRLTVLGSTAHSALARVLPCLGLMRVRRADEVLVAITSRHVMKLN